MSKEKIASLAFQGIAEREGYGHLVFDDMPECIKANYLSVADKIIEAGFGSEGSVVEKTVEVEKIVEKIVDASPEQINTAHTEGYVEGYEAAKAEFYVEPVAVAEAPVAEAENPA